MNGSGVRFDERLGNLFDSMIKRGYGGGLPWWAHRGFNHVSDGMKMKKSYALFNPLNDNPNQIGSRGLWGKMLPPVKRGYGNGFGFGDYDSGKRGFGGATFDHGFGNSFATMKKRGGDQFIQLQKMKRGYGAGFGFGDYDSGKRGFGGATFDHGFGNSFATMKKRGLGFV